MDLTLRHPTYERRDPAAPGATLATASPVTILASLQSNTHAPRLQAVRRWAPAAAAMLVAHVIGGVFVLRLIDHVPPPPVPERELTVSLIAPPAPVAVPVAPPEKPVEQPKPKPVVHHVPVPKPITPPTPIMTTQAPSPDTAAAPAPPPPAPPAPAAPAAQATPSAAPSHASNGAPVNVAHLTCDGEPPEYPVLSKRRGETGTVVVAITVDTQGVVRAATIRTSSGFERLDDAALQAARERSCQPYLENGTPVSATALLPFAFRLQG
ncbi:energy transducer TonB [Pararobbsia silviterrae]|uniref:Energy transducer TonB n=1 Tax=Pararobbsia silviterrae TaxID=1792498 RepID=A0A494X821_9BURK|nr:energy transducer TonB [Pararobbsia silviterrae]RKP46610.1 energy transducer TonB [Pararobbsia silviterrae]